MKKIGLIVLLLVCSGIFVSAGGVSETHVYYFYSTGCSHCANVAESGVLDRVSLLENVIVEKFNVLESQENRDLFNKYCDYFNLTSRGWPFAVIECEDKFSYLIGDVPIIDGLEDSVANCDGISVSSDSVTKEGEAETITLFSIIVASLIDSINPCAFGVLIFLMASLLKMGSSRRALRAGLLYSFVVFLVYFLIGWGLFRVIDSYSSSTYFYYFYLAIAILVFVLGLVQLKDVFWYGKGLTLRISSKSKPIIEKLMSRGSLISVIVLGVIVSLFELPCTGEVYLGILTLMSLHQVFGLFYLFLYNLIFVLPLIILTYLVYKGTSTQRLQEWTVSNRKYMKLISGLLLVGLASYIFVRAIGFV